MINVIVLLNLLISIVSDTYARIKENYGDIMYKDMLYLIVENKMYYILRKRLSNQYQMENMIISIPSDTDKDQEQLES